LQSHILFSKKYYNIKAIRGQYSVIFVCKEKEHRITLPDVWVLGVCLCETTASGQEE